MRRLLVLVPLLLAVGLPFIDSLVAQPPKAAVKKGRKIAVLIGVNGYQDAKFPNLEFAEADMLSLKEKLERSGFEVILLLGSGKGDAEASRTNIAAVLLDKREENRRFAFREVTDADDQILVAFSGHGEQIIVEEKDDDDKPAKREVPHFAPKRAESGKPSTQISLNEVLRTFNGGKAKALLLVDACRSFAENRDATKGAVIDRNRADSLRPNVGGMFAASDRQAAREKGGHGLFFHAVLEVMEQENCKDKDGNVVWSRMTDEISDAVRKRSKELFPTLKDDEHQVPDPFGRFRDKFVLAAAGETAPPAKPKDPPIAPPPIDSAKGDPKAGDERELAIADGVKMTFCWIPKGKATLGSPATEKDRSDNEKEREYEEKTGYWLGKHAVTQQEWTAVMGTTPFAFHKDGTDADYVKRVAGLDTGRFPAERVSFDDIYGNGWKDGDAPLAGSFLAKVNGRAGMAAAFGKGAKLVLPHEDRWEYAYRGGEGNKKAYYWGDSLNGDRANCYGNNPYGTETKGAYLQRPAAVGSYESKAKHPWGLCDMSGNAYQWCENKYSGDSANRVLRGGSWDVSARFCRAAHRNGSAPDYRFFLFGFRVCVVLE